MDLDEINLNLKSTKTDSRFNYNFLLTAFSDTTMKAKVDSQKIAKWRFCIDQVSLKNFRFHYYDEYEGLNMKTILKNMELKMDQIDLVKSVFRIDELRIDGEIANILVEKTSNPDSKKSGSLLPTISANKIQLNHLSVSFSDSIGKRSLQANVNGFELRDGSVDFQKKIVSVNSLKMDDNSVAYHVKEKPEAKNEFNPDHLVYNHLTFEATGILYDPDQIKVQIKRFTSVDQNNFSILNVETGFSMDQHSVTAKNLKIKTTNSALDVDLNLQYSSAGSLKDSMKIGNLNLDMRNASIGNSDILYFIPQLSEHPFFKNRTITTTISGNVKGPINNLFGKNISINTGVRTILKTDFNIKGLPKVQNAFFDFPDLRISSCKRDIEMLAGPSIPVNIDFPENLTMQVAFKGKIKAFESSINMTSSLGAANLFASVDQNEKFQHQINHEQF